MWRAERARATAALAQHEAIEDLRGRHSPSLLELGGCGQRFAAPSRRAGADRLPAR